LAIPHCLIAISSVKRNIRLSATVGLAGMALPFGLGAALSVPLYHQFIDKSVAFTNFVSLPLLGDTAFS
jgi:hypothetical protein